MTTITAPEKTRTNVVHDVRAGLLYVTVTGAESLSDATVCKRASGAVAAWKTAHPDITTRKTTQRHTVPFSTSGRTVNTFYYTATKGN